MATGGIDLRFPGQWYQAESGLYQNWMRDYDPTTGRYIEADPLGLVDGASVYGYVRQNPGRWTDPFGLNTLVVIGGGTGLSNNPFGHASIATTGSGIYSWGTDDAWGSSVQNFLYNQSRYRDSTAIVIPTTPAQEQAILDYLRKKIAAGEPYDLTENNCATMVMDALDAAGLPNGLIAAMSAGVVLSPYYTPRTAELVALSQKGAIITHLSRGQNDFSGLSEFDPN